MKELSQLPVLCCETHCLSTAQWHWISSVSWDLQTTSLNSFILRSLVSAGNSGTGVSMSGLYTGALPTLALCISRQNLYSMRCLTIVNIYNDIKRLRTSHRRRTQSPCTITVTTLYIGGHWHFPCLERIYTTSHGIGHGRKCGRRLGKSTTSYSYR